MRQHFRFKDWAFLVELRPRISRVLEGVTGKRGKRFHFANSIEPGANQGAKFLPPTFCPKYAQNRVEDEGLSEPDNHVPSMFQESVNSIQPSNCGRSRNSVGLKRLLETPHPAGAEVVVFNNAQNRT